MYSVRSSSHTSKASTTRRSQAGARRSMSRSRITLTEALILSACALAVAFSFARTLAQPSPQSHGSVPIRVKASQTLWDLAIDHPVEGLTTAETVEYIQRLNERSEPALAVGEVVLVPDAPDNATAMAAR